MPPPSTDLELRAPSRAPWFAALSFLALAVLAVASAWHPLNANSDFWAHAATGRWILAHGQVPRHMLFEWTDHSPWVAHSWGTQVWFALMMRVGESLGPLLAVLWTVVLGLAACGALLWRWRGRAGDTFLVPIFGSMCVWLAGSRFLPRPEMCTLLFLAVLLVWCEGWTRPGAWDAASGQPLWKRALAVLVLFALWANLHGLVFVGLAFLVAAAVCEFLQEALPRSNGTSASEGGGWRWAALCVAAGLGTLLNPYGVGLWSVLKFAEAAKGLGAYQLVEFQSPFAAPALGPEYQVCIVMLAVVGALAWALGPRRRASVLSWLVLGTVLVCSARRHAAIFAFAVLIVFAASEFSGTRILNLVRGYCARTGARSSFAQASGPQVLTARLVALAAAILWVSLAQPQYIGSTVTVDLPVQRAAFLAQPNLPGRLFSDYETSSYLCWRLGELQPQYIHLLNVSAQVNRGYHDILSLQAAGLAELGHGPINTVSLRPPDATDSTLWPPLAIRIAFDARRWAMTYAANDGFVWVRRTLATAAFCHAHEVKPRVPPEFFLPPQMRSNPTQARALLRTGIIPGDAIF